MNKGDCLNCDGTGWVCERHPDRPWSGNTTREDACNCCGCGAPCPVCVRPGAMPPPRWEAIHASAWSPDETIH